MPQDLINYTIKKTKETGAQYKAYGLFGIVNFPIYYIVWLYPSPETYESRATSLKLKTTDFGIF